MQTHWWMFGAMNAFNSSEMVSHRSIILQIQLNLANPTATSLKTKNMNKMQKQAEKRFNSNTDNLSSSFIKYETINSKILPMNLFVLASSQILR